MKTSVTFPHRSAYLRLIALWVLRAFSPGLGRSRYFGRRIPMEDDIGGFLGVPVDGPDGPVPPVEVGHQLDDLKAKLESSRPQPRLTAVQRGNFVCLGELLGLNAIEIELLQYLGCALIDPILQDTHQRIGRVYHANPARYLAIVLGLPEPAVRKALGPNGRLRVCGMIGNGGGDSGRIEFFSGDIAKELLRRTCNPKTLIRQFGTQPPPPELTLDDFPQQRHEMEILRLHLHQALAKRRPGVNVLIYGPPGTGKTQLTRVLGKVLDARVFEVAAEDVDGEPVSGPQRFGALRATQSIFRGTRTLLVFDEAEDVLARPSVFAGSAAHTHKGWFNQLLENNRLPVLWVSNSIGDLDPAFARRFDVVVEMPVPPRAQRRRMIEKEADRLLSPATIERLADCPDLAPAVITRSCRVIRGIARKLPSGQRDAALGRLITNTLRAQGHRNPLTNGIQPLDPATYDLAHLNTTADLAAIAARLHQQPSARLCLYGPPGTGKTAFAHWLAADLGKPIMVRKASELLSPYVGMTEQNIAASFEQAAEDGAVLVIDEVDSFLRDRRNAQRSWEVTQVNEMLTRIEAFPGILIASTNLIEGIDQASLRRFDLKLHFDYLQPGQTRRLFAAHCHKLGFGEPTLVMLTAAAGLEAATPGDFAAVARRHSFQPVHSPADLLDKLREEIQHKLPGLRRIGFCH
jgi:SpoVK/Ycf46/Vps4 family AAA+-type ATPase